MRLFTNWFDGMRGSRNFRQAVVGVWGPGLSDKKHPLTTFFLLLLFFNFSPQLILQKTNGYFQRKSFSKVPERCPAFFRGEGVQVFPGGGGGGVQLLISYIKLYNQ